MKTKLKGLQFADVAEIQEAVTDKLKNAQKEEFSATFQKLNDRTEACIYVNGAYFELKNVCVFLVCLRFLKKSIQNLWTALYMTSMLYEKTTVHHLQFTVRISYKQAYYA